MARKTLAELQADPPTFSNAQRTTLNAMTDDEIDRKADADETNPTLTDEALVRAAFARAVRLTREKTGLTQQRFADKYLIAVSRLRDWERGRYRPDPVAAAYMKTIRHAPETVKKALEAKD